MLKQGDSVIMHTCGEADHYKGIIWTCESDEWKLPSDTSVVKLKGFSGAFATEFLNKINPTDDEIVICESCDKAILADSKGYEVYLESDGAYCLQCEKAVSEKLQAQAFVHNALNETEITHTVVKNEDIEKLSLEEKRELSYLEARITEIRESQGKEPYPRYIIINTDEEPQMIKEIIQVMKRFEKWG